MPLPQYPTDIDPESGCRLPLPKREGLSPEAQATFDRLTSTSSQNLRGLRGPGGIQLHSPDLARVSRPLNHYLRFESGLGDRLRELAILVTAREHDIQGVVVHCAKSHFARDKIRRVRQR